MRIAIHQELPWARSISNEEFKLFMMEQTWATGADLEAHIGSAHAMGFNAAMLKHRMLVTEPSVSIFGEPLTAEQLRALAQEAGMALAQRAAESVSPTEAEVRSLPQSLPNGLSNSGPLPKKGSPDPSRSSTPLQSADSRSSILRTSGAMALRK